MYRVCLTSRTGGVTVLSQSNDFLCQVFSTQPMMGVISVWCWSIQQAVIRQNGGGVLVHTLDSSIG